MEIKEQENSNIVIADYERQDEKILCAAYWIDDKIDYAHQPKNIDGGYVISGYRHGQIITVMHKFGIDKNIRNAGFLTNHNRWVNRKEARKIALKAKQITEDSLHDTDLFSEDLY